MPSYKCKNCGDPFFARAADRNRGWAKFCSKSCKAKEQTRRTGRGAPRDEYCREDDGSFTMSPADLAAGGYGDAGPDDSFGDGKW